MQPRNSPGTDMYDQTSPKLTGATNLKEGSFSTTIYSNCKDLHVTHTKEVQLR